MRIGNGVNVVSTPSDMGLLPLGLGSSRSFAAAPVMTSEKSIEQGPDGLALVVVQEPGGLEGQPEALVVAQPIVFAKDQEICRGRQRNGQLGNDTERRLIGPEFVAPELAEMDSGPFGQRSLGHAPLASQGGQSLGELHGPHAIKLGIDDTTYIVYNQLDTVTTR